MGSGYIQLLAVGSEVNIFNLNPNITFFKIYYRRHTNFFISNMEINANDIKSLNANNLSNNKITFNIPKNGDLLAKTYLNLTIDDNYFELFEFNGELCSTLNKNIIDTYDCYYVKTNNFSIEDINNIHVAKIIFSSYTENIFLNVLDSNILNESFFLNLIKNQKNVYLQTGENNVFYNMDFNTLFFSFKVLVSDKNEILNNDLMKYILISIDYFKLNFIQIDFKLEKISFRIQYNNDKKYYKMLMDLILSKFDLLIDIKININYIYLSLGFSLDIYYLMIELFYVNSQLFELELIIDKLKSNKNVFSKKINNEINNLILFKKPTTTIYLSILNGNEVSYSILYLMENISFFGNLTNEYYNNLLIENSNGVLNLFNLNNTKLSLNLLIKIYISLICYNSIPSLQMFIFNVNINKINKLTQIQNFYLSNVKLFNYKLINPIMNSDVLILNLKSFYLILYSKNIYENFDTKKYTKPFTDNIITNYSSTINNFYFNENMTLKINKYFNDNTNDKYYIVTQCIFYNNLINTNLEQSLTTNNLNLNYINNNNLFELTDNLDVSNIQNKSLDTQSSISDELSYIENINTDSNFDYTIVLNCLNILIVESYNLLNNIESNSNYKIYDSNGKMSNLFYNSDMSQIIFPLSSNIYVYTNGITNNNLNNINNNINNINGSDGTDGIDGIDNTNGIYYNKNIVDYLIDLKINVFSLIKIFTDDFKINMNPKETNINIDEQIIKFEFYKSITKYYDNSEIFIEQINMNFVNNYLNEIKTINYKIIYEFNDLSLINLNNFIMYQQFTYVDKNIFNNSFSNFYFKKKNSDGSISETNFIKELNYEKFIFTINSPLYRIYFYFTFLSKLTIDTLGFKLKINDDISFLRDLTLSYLIMFFNIYNGLKLNVNSIINKRFNLDSLNKLTYFIDMYFISYDKINIFENKEFLNLIKNKSSKDFVFLYNSFYFIKKNMSEYKINDPNFLYNIPNICNNFKYNYDDLIIITFLNVLNDNKKYFLNFDKIYDLTLIFFEKNNFNFDKLIDYLNKNYTLSISTTNITTRDKTKNNFYYNCYYTNFYIGSTFDNININNTDTINSIISMTTLLNYENLFSYMYSFKEYVVKQYINFLDFTINIINPLEYFQSKLFVIFINKTYIDTTLYNSYIESIISYININYVYLLLYNISEFNFNNSIGIINKYLDKYNTVNDSNISLVYNSNTTKYTKMYFYKNNYIVIIYYYIYFIFECLKIDIDRYNTYLSNLNTYFNNNNIQNNERIITFDEFIIGKYSTNIYTDCIDDLINLYVNLDNKILLDFSAYYIYIPIEKLNEKLNSINDVDDKNDKYLFTNPLTNNQEIKQIKNRVLYSGINYTYNFNSDTNITNDFEMEFINENFIQLFSNLIENLVYKTNTILFTSYSYNGIILKNIVNKKLPLETNYLEFKNYYYSNSIYKLTDIYSNLLKSYESNIFNKTNYDKRIIEYILYNLKNFYFRTNNNYFNTIYYFTNNAANSVNDVNIEYNHTLKLYKNVYNNAFIFNKIIDEDESNLLIGDLTDFANSLDIYTLLSKYVNGLISNSLIYEQYMNRIIYLLCTNYVIYNSRNKTHDVLKKTLYESVKLFKKSKNDLNYEIKKIYQYNTSIYSNQSIFQIYNYENMFNNISYTQNYWINQIISEIDLDYKSSNSFYSFLIKFIDYVKFYQLKLSDFKLSNGENILIYFKNNYDEFLDYIFNLICLNEPYSPNLIFMNIISLIKSNIIDGKLSIETDHLKKKIVVYLFFIWTILTFTPKLLINYFEIDKNIFLEYDLENEYVDIGLNDVLKFENNMEIINWIIYETFNLDLSIQNKNLEITNFPDFLSSNYQIINMIKHLKLICSPIPHFNILCDKYIDIYSKTIGDKNIYNDNLFINAENFEPTITNLVSDINTIYNNDINQNNTNQYNLTFETLKLIGMKYDYVIYDLSNYSNNKIFLTCDYLEKTNLNYSKTPIGNFNMLYNMFALLLENYGISYTNLNDNFNQTLNYLRKSANTINDLLEMFKGIRTSYDISSELSPNNNLNKYNYFMSKLFNIRKLYTMVETNNNLSLIAPNDYDNLPIMINYNYGYKNFYEKYYLYKYNYNNFNSNYTVIYKNLYNYYLELTKNAQSIKNIKNYDTNLYIWLFLNLIDSYISNVYFDSNEQIPTNYIVILNQIIKIYFVYNYTFRSKNNSLDVINLSIQNKYSNVEYLNNFSSIKEYLIEYYYYQLFSINIDSNDSSSFKTDLISFFNLLDIKTNMNFIYTRNFLNCVLKFEVIIGYLYHKLNTIYKIEYKTIKLDKIKNFLISYITDEFNIQSFFNAKIVNGKKENQNVLFYKKLFEGINNLINSKIFYEKFINSLNYLIYWINDLSYDLNVINSWDLNFNNYVFDYYDFIDNEYILKKFTIDIFSFYYLVENYIGYILSNDDGYTNDKFVKLYNMIFENVDDDLEQNHQILILNPFIVNNLLSMKYGDELFVKDQMSKENLFIKKTVNDFKFSNCIENIFQIILNINWGITNYDIITNTKKKNLRTNITFYNLYYLYLNNKLLVESGQYTNFNFENGIKLLDELYILYYIILYVYTVQYIDNFLYSNLVLEYLTQSHKYIQYGIQIQTINLVSNFAIYMDCINSNLVPNNTIGNYYKNIQNESIYDNLKYNLINFKNNVNNYSNYMNQIFNNQISNLDINTENNLGSNTFYNLIINTYNNLTSIAENYIDNNIGIFEKVTGTLYNNINNQLFILMNNFGAVNNFSIGINNNSSKKIFNQNNYIGNDSQITILSLVNNTISNDGIFNNSLVLLFYYSCFITWSTLGINIKNDTLDVSNLFYYLTNLINSKILELIQKIKKSENILINEQMYNLPDESFHDFFDGLNTLLFKNYNNYEFTLGVKKYFQLLILNISPTFDLSENKTQKNNIYISNIFQTTNYEKNIKLIENDKNLIINYKYLLGLLADFNNSKLIYYIKSIDNNFTDIKIQSNLINYIIGLNKGLINKYGIIQLIDRFELLFDDEIISQYNNQNYKIFVDNFQNLNKQGLLDKMLGIDTNDENIVDGIKPYIKIAYKYNYIIPIKFFFENYFNSIPLISCMNTNIKIILYLKSINIYKNSYVLKNLTSLNIKSKLNMDFILVERDERIKLCSGKIDNLIEKNNYYEITKNINKEVLNTNTDKKTFIIEFDFELNNLIKELIWDFKLTIGNYEINLIENSTTNNFNGDFKPLKLEDLTEANYDFIIGTKIYINNVRRDGINFLDADVLPNYNKIITLLNPYRYNTKVKKNNKYCVYSFALDPTEFQPSGAINMYNYRKFTIQLTIDKIKFLTYLEKFELLFGLKNANIKLSLSTYEYNIIRYQSGLAGLLFVT